MVVAYRNDRAPDPPLEEIRPEPEQEHEHGQGHEIEPLVGVQLEAEGGVGLAEHDALRAARPVLEVFQDLRDRQRQRKGGQRQIETLEPEGRQPEEESDDQAEHARHRKRPAIGDVPAVHHDRGDVGADCVERAMAQRELAVEASEHVQPEDRDRVDVNLGKLEEPEVAQRERQRAGDQREDQQAGDAPQTRAAHTRFTTVVPKSPVGLTSNTTMIIASATVNLSSVPMKCTYVPTRFSTTPTMNPPSTAPPGLVKPPSVAAANA